MISRWELSDVDLMGSRYRLALGGSNRLDAGIIAVSSVMRRH